MKVFFFFGEVQVLNLPQQTGRFNFRKQFPYKEIVYKPDLSKRKSGKPVVFDMDMSAGDFVALIYLLKVPVEFINVKVVLPLILPLCLIMNFLLHLY